MASTPRKPKGRDTALSALDVAIQASTLAGGACCIPPAQIAFGSSVALLTMIRDTLANEGEYVDVALSCAEVCEALERGLGGRNVDELGHSVLMAIQKLNTTVARIQGKAVKQGKRNVVSRLFHAKADKDTIAGLKQDLLRILQIFNTELAINTHVKVAEMHRNASAAQEGSSGKHLSTQPSIPSGESPPPAPRACFGRDQLIEEVVGLAEKIEPIALIGAGGIGKTSVALTVLHHDRIIKEFGDDRRFIRCDQFPPSRIHFLARLSKVIGALVENPEDLTPLRPILSSKKMLIVLDNIESILDPQGANSRELYAIVDELCQFKTVCVCITSRITTVPRYCKRPEIPTLSMEAACEIFYGIYGDDEKSDTINNLLQRLEFHALSITLLATTASHNTWDYDRLAKEWETHRANVLRTDYNESLAATIELSLASPTFRKLGPSARDLLGVVAFFPQGVDHKNLEWFFPTTPDRTNIFDKFCLLSLAYRNDGFVTMLAPLRDYLSPQQPKSSPFLCQVKECYFEKLSIEVYCGKPGYREAKWIKLEHINVEHLLNVFTSVDADSVRVWEICAHFMNHLYWHKERLVTLESKIRNLPNDHPSKAECLYRLGWLYEAVGDFETEEEILYQALTLSKERGEKLLTAEILRIVADANVETGHYEQGIRGVKEAMEIHEELGNKSGKAHALKQLARLWCGGNQLDEAEEAALQAKDFFSEIGEIFEVGKICRTLGQVYESKGETEKAISYFEKAIEVGSSGDWPGQSLRSHYLLAKILYKNGKLSEADTHLHHAKAYVAADNFYWARVMLLHASVWYQQSRFTEALSEALSAANIFEKLGAPADLKQCQELLQKIQKDTNTLAGVETS